MTVDPGWGAPIRTLPLGLIPQVGIRRELDRSRRGEVHGLVALREIFVHLTVAVVGAGGLVAVAMGTGDAHRSTSDTSVGLVVVLVGATGALIASARLNRPMDCTDAVTLAKSYMGRFLYRLAVANLCVAAGVVGVVIANDAWLFLVGLPFAALALTRLAPTQRHVEAEQARLTATGCSTSLVDALAVLPPAPPRG